MVRKTQKRRGRRVRRGRRNISKKTRGGKMSSIFSNEGEKQRNKNYTEYAKALVDYFCEIIPLKLSYYEHNIINISLIKIQTLKIFESVIDNIHDIPLPFSINQLFFQNNLSFYLLHIIKMVKNIKEEDNSLFVDTLLSQSQIMEAKRILVKCLSKANELAKRILPKFTVEEEKIHKLSILSNHFGTPRFIEYLLVEVQEKINSIQENLRSLDMAEQNKKTISEAIIDGEEMEALLQKKYANELAFAELAFAELAILNEKRSKQSNKKE